MLRTLLLTGALLTASGTALAHGGAPVYGRVIQVQPSVSVSFGTGRYDGFRVLYERGGNRYWTHAMYRPGPTILVPQYVPVTYAPRYAPDHGRGWNDHRGRHDDRRDHPSRGHPSRDRHHGRG